MPADVIIACDFSSRTQTMDFLRNLDNERPYLKIGMELFYSEGPEFVRMLKDAGYRIFLDLKLHDIPNTIRRTMSVLSRLHVDMVNVHAAGTVQMMQAAMEGAVRPDGSRSLVIAVTQLTSTGQEQLNQELGIPGKLSDAVLAYAKNARAAGLDGVVCSALEAEIVHNLCGRSFLTVTPGIRLADDEPGDQRRIATPSLAASLGSDYIVVGRPITQAENPLAAYRRFRQDFLKRSV